MTGIVQMGHIYGSHLDNFINEAELVASDYTFLKNAYIFVSATWGTTSWLDHCLSSEDGHGKKVICVH